MLLLTLDITKNRFRGLENDIVLKLDNIEDLRLDNNPWSCDLCFIVPMLERVNTSTTFRNVVCYQPYNFKGKRLGNVRHEYLSWCTAASLSGDANYFFIGNDGNIGLIAAGTSVCLLLLTLIFIIGAYLYSRRHAAKYYTHEDKLSKDGEAIFETHSPLFCEDRELSFKFPIDNEKRMSISTIDEIKKEHAVQNGT